MEKKTNKNAIHENVNVSKKFVDAAIWIENLHMFFVEENERGIYLENQEDIFTELTSAIQKMIGCNAYWNIVD